MTHRIVVNVETGVTSIVEYTPEEQAIHDAAVAAQLQRQKHRLLLKHRLWLRHRRHSKQQLKAQHHDPRTTKVLRK
jgi:hypothetical protein